MVQTIHNEILVHLLEFQYRMQLFFSLFSTGGRKGCSYVARPEPQAELKEVHELRLELCDGSTRSSRGSESSMTECLTELQDPTLRKWVERG